MTTILLWDIDGTLLTTARAGVYALEDAASEIVGAQVDLSDMDTAGLTDRQIAINILERYGVTPDPLKIDRLLQRFQSGPNPVPSLHQRLRARYTGLPRPRQWRCWSSKPET